MTRREGGWVSAAVLLFVYCSLPGGDEALAPETPNAARADGEPAQLAIVALAALAIGPCGPRCRALAQLNLFVGLCSTLLMAASVDVCAALAAHLSAYESPIRWGAHLLPAGGWRLGSLQEHLVSGARLDPDHARAREILINALESQLRRGLGLDPIEARDLGVVGLVDAFETAGNQLFRLAEAFQAQDVDEFSLPQPTQGRSAAA